jgi:hypothetical protein
MFYINMGIAILLSQIVPIHRLILLPILRLFHSSIKSLNIPNVVLGSILLIFTLSALYLAAHIFTKYNKLQQKLPTKIPGTYFIITGLVLYFIFKVVLIFASTIEGGGPAYAVRQLGIFVIYPAYALIGAGLYKAYQAQTTINS